KPSGQAKASKETPSKAERDPRNGKKDTIPGRGKIQTRQAPSRGKIQARQAPSRGKIQARQAPSRGKIQAVCVQETNRNQCKQRIHQEHRPSTELPSTARATARATNAEYFKGKVKEIFQTETDAAVRALQTGLYIGWRCPEDIWDCIRVGQNSKCFCGHLLKEHKIYTGHGVSVRCLAEHCCCPSFIFIPSCPEEVGEMWLKRRIGFDSKNWRAKCRCKHSHEDHLPKGSHRCRIGGCRCLSFESGFLCAACDRKWEAHQTYFETTELRKQGNLPYGEDYMPFTEMPHLQNAALRGCEEDPCEDLSQYGGRQALPPSSHPVPRPSLGPCNMTHKKNGKSS
ncbi:protein FAM221B, partial [Ascaphus truei]|uniref:protein FAM221B n=1 Tax=Ascaphus truei TaxID=8439 RepID=UPI003F59ED06